MVIIHVIVDAHPEKIRKETQESKELVDLIDQKKSVLQQQQQQNASKKATIKILVENLVAINQASNEVKNKTNQEFQEHAKRKL